MTITLPGVVFLLAVATAMAAAGASLAGWLRGRPAEMSLLLCLTAVPKRYLVDVHAVVARDPKASRMHMCAAGSFVVACVLVILVHILHWAVHITGWALIAAGAFMLVGSGFVFARRYPRRIGRLSGAPYSYLSAALAGFGAFYAVAALPLVGVIQPILWTGGPGLGLALAGACSTAFLIPGLVVGPMRHALAGVLFLAFHPRAARFSVGNPADAALTLLDLEAEKLGVEYPTDFMWNQRLSFDACVQCGRCEEACPAYAAGAPLNPKKLIYDLFSASSGTGHDCNYTGHPHPGRSIGVARGGPALPVVGVDRMVSPDTLWACTTCRACVEECPMMIEHVDAVIEMRRFQTLELGATPGTGPQVLEALALTDTMSAQPISSRLAWASDLELSLARDLRQFDILLWIGEGGFELRHQRTLRALVTVLRAAHVEFAVLGDEELDVGDTARRLGDEATFQSLAQRNINSIGQYKFGRILTADPHVLNCLKSEYPALGGHYEVVHHTTFVAELLNRGMLRLGRIDAGAVTYHDPCYLGRYNGEYESPRRILSALGVDILEMTRSRRRSFCCGAGGGAAITDVTSEKRIPDLRMAEARGTHATTLAVACPNCAVMLEGVAGERLVVTDVIELVALAVDAARSETRAA